MLRIKDIVVKSSGALVNFLDKSVKWIEWLLLLPFNMPVRKNGIIQYRVIKKSHPSCEDVFVIYEKKSHGWVAKLPKEDWGGYPKPYTSLTLCVGEIKRLQKEQRDYPIPVVTTVIKEFSGK